MSLPHIKPYGSWKSPISSETIVSKAVRLSFVDIDKNYIYYDEGRPSEGGRTTLIREDRDGNKKEVIPSDLSVRTTIQEYGGKSFFINGTEIYFINLSDQNIYKIDKDSNLEKITSDDENTRYADLVFDNKRNIIFCIQEVHEKEEVTNSIIKIDLDTKQKDVLVEKHDFYASLALSPDGKKLSYINWDHPNMPWDSSYLIESEITEDGLLVKSRKVAGGDDESIFQPSYSPDNTLFFVSDRTGFYNIYYLDGVIEPLYPMNADFGYPQWQFGFSTYCFIDKDEESYVYCAYAKKGKDYLSRISLKNKKLEEIAIPFIFYFNLKSFGDSIAFIAGSEIEEKSVLLLDTVTDKYDFIKRPRDLEIDHNYISVAENIEFTSRDGEVVYAFYYPPKNIDYVSSKEESPPLIVKSHGGPTAHNNPVLNLETQYFTSRGYGVVAVNYRGSSGYGRKYRDSLKGKWGLLDVTDCIDAATYLAKYDKADIDRLIIKGGSAGGYTTLAALTFFDTFKAGASYYGVADLESLALHTHKFEAHYLDKLIGPYPERKDLYYARSPINFVDQLSCPIILLQGGEDKVVPKEQAELMYEKLKSKNIPVAYLLFDKEQHGFRIGDNIKKALEAELYFYSKIFDIEINEKINPITIENL